MHFPGLSLFVHPVPVIDAVSNVGGLLYLGQKDTRSKCMNTACRYIKNISFVYRFIIQDIPQGFIFQVFLIEFPADLPVKTRNQFCSRISINNIPHF